MSNPYSQWIRDFEGWMTQGKRIVPGGVAVPRPAVEAMPAPGGVLLFSAHPDDECIVGGLPLRLGREADLAVTNIAVTLGSNRERRAGRWDELRNACGFLGWGVQRAAPGGLEKISPKGREEDPANWANAVMVIRDLLARCQPRVVFIPHLADWNGTHIGVHQLVMEALAGLPPAFECILVETEFWAAMDTPNLMVESSPADVADLVAAVSLHVGEVRRNPYHLTLPAWMQDNVRRGGEIVGGQGGAAPDFTFCTLYRVRHWKQGGVRVLPIPGRAVDKGQSLRAWWAELTMAATKSTLV
jgi:LmbE family N-acetylglucosaminyl deacetylase